MAEWHKKTLMLSSCAIALFSFAQVFRYTRQRFLSPLQHNRGEWNEICGVFAFKNTCEKLSCKMCFLTQCLSDSRKSTDLAVNSRFCGFAGTLPLFFITQETVFTSICRDGGGIYKTETICKTSKHEAQARDTVGLLRFG